MKWLHVVKLTSLWTENSVLNCRPCYWWFVGAAKDWEHSYWSEQQTKDRCFYITVWWNVVVFVYLTWTVASWTMAFAVFFYESHALKNSKACFDGNFLKRKRRTVKDDVLSSFWWLTVSIVTGRLWFCDGRYHILSVWVTALVQL